MSTLDGARIVRVHLEVPPAGGWTADVWLDATTLPALGPVTLTVGDLQLLGRATVRGFDDHPVGGALGRVRVLGGAGWAEPLARGGAYSVASGVRLSTVLQDLAGLVGESYDAPPDALLTAEYRWSASTPRERVDGRAVLADLVTRGAVPTWRVAPSGRTRFDDWPALGPADASGRVLKRSSSRGRRTVGLDTRVQAFLPGATLEGATIRRLIVRETASKLIAEVYQQ